MMTQTLTQEGLLFAVKRGLQNGLTVEQSLSVIDSQDAGVAANAISLLSEQYGLTTEMSVVWLLDAAKSDLAIEQVMHIVTEYTLSFDQFMMAIEYHRQCKPVGEQRQKLRLYDFLRDIYRDATSWHLTDKPEFYNVKNILNAAQRSTAWETYIEKLADSLLKYVRWQASIPKPPKDMYCGLAEDIRRFAGI